MRFEVFCPTQIIFGEGVFSRVGEEVAHFGKRCLVVCGQRFAKEEGLIDKVFESFQTWEIKGEIFHGVEPNPGITTVEKGRRVCKEFKPDSILALGGGSVIDAAKAIALLYSRGGKLEDYFVPHVVKEEVIPIIAIPTTAGTGSEVTQFSVITCGNRKKVIMGYSIIPRTAILDPYLTLTLPPEITVASGMDAFSHAIEALWAKKSNPLIKPLAREAIKLIFQNLPLAFSQGENLIAREKLLYASLLAGISINSAGTTLVHAMGYPLTTLYDLPHGIANAILLPYVMEFNFPAIRGFLAQLSEWLGESFHTAQRLKAWEGIQAVVYLADLVGIPYSLERIGVKEEEIRNLTEIAWEAQRNIQNNPRETKMEDIEEIYRRAWQGQLGEEVYIE
ncbi:MAG TPA: iron-containing alcohol dehydrogenase [bacterium]|nr:iron-containing alcohol dehydrogenase [bacterium]HEX68600.1 iron-containing alcohol dehydrogenase [bacterium]